jgi:hypothetical protein
MPLSFLKKVTNGITNQVSHQVNKQARNITQSLPERLQRPARAVKGFLNGKPLQQTKRLLTYLRHRDDYDRLQDALQNFQYFAAVLIARDLGVFETLDRRPMSPDALADGADIHPRAAKSILRILETDGLVEREEHLYELSEFGSEFLAPGEMSIDPFLEFLSAFTGSYDDIVDGMRTGELPPKMDVFSDKADYEAYLESVNYYLDIAGRDLLTRVELPEIESFIVGSMGVSFSGLLLNEYPTATVTYGCLDHLVDHIPALRMEYDIDPHRVTGMHRHGGEPAEDEWGDESFDLVFLTKKMLLEPDEKMGEKFARKAYDVLNEDGVALFWETIHPDDEPTPFSRAGNAVMDLAASPIGFSLTEDSFASKLKEIGFDQVEFVHPMGGETSFALARKTAPRSLQSGL